MILHLLRYLLAAIPALLAILALSHPMFIDGGLFSGHSREPVNQLPFLVACLAISISCHVRNSRLLLTMWVFYAAALVAYGAVHPELLGTIKGVSRFALVPPGTLYLGNPSLMEIAIYNLVAVLLWGVGLPALKRFLRKENLAIASGWLTIGLSVWALFALHQYTVGFTVWS